MRRNIKKIKIGNWSSVSIRTWTRITSNNDNRRRVSRESISTIGEKKFEKYFLGRNESNIKQTKETTESVILRSRNLYKSFKIYRKIQNNTCF